MAFHEKIIQICEVCLWFISRYTPFKATIWAQTNFNITQFVILVNNKFPFPMKSFPLFQIANQLCANTETKKSINILIEFIKKRTESQSAFCWRWICTGDCTQFLVDDCRLIDFLISFPWEFVSKISILTASLLRRHGEKSIIPHTHSPARVGNNKNIRSGVIFLTLHYLCQRRRRAGALIEILGRALAQ